jgi:hypothetical protein
LGQDIVFIKDVAITDAHSKDRVKYLGTIVRLQRWHDNCYKISMRFKEVVASEWGYIQYSEVFYT